MHPHEQAPSASPAAPEAEGKFLTEEQRRARIQELGKRAELVADVYGLVSRRLAGTTESVHGRLCNLADEVAPGSADPSLHKRYEGMIKDLVDFDGELFSVLSRTLGLSEDDLEAIKTQWRLDNIHDRGWSAPDRLDGAARTT